MDWKDVGRLVAPLAPSLGGILGGLIPFPGGALIGQALGNVIARQFGVPATPEAISDAIKRTEADVAIAKLNAATEQARIEVQGFVEAEKAYYATVQTSLEQTGLTMRAELEHQSLFYTGWRPCAGWLFDIFSAVFGVLLSVAAVQAAFLGDPSPLKTLVDAWPAFLALLGPLGLMVGVYVIGRSNEKAKAIIAAPVKPVPAIPAKK